MHNQSLHDLAATFKAKSVEHQERVAATKAQLRRELDELQATYKAPLDQALIAAYESGESIAALAGATGMKPQSIKSVLNKAGALREE